MIKRLINNKKRNKPRKLLKRKQIIKAEINLVIQIKINKQFNPNKNR